MTDAQTPPELTKDQQISILTRSLDTRGRALKMAFALVGVLMFVILAGGAMLKDTNNDLKKGRQERRDYQQEERYLDCFVSVDDAELAHDEVSDRVEELCAGVELPE